jgi:hypothetical protein
MLQRPLVHASMPHHPPAQLTHQLNKLRRACATAEGSPRQQAETLRRLAKVCWNDLYLCYQQAQEAGGQRASLEQLSRDVLEAYGALAAPRQELLAAVEQQLYNAVYRFEGGVHGALC